jgi:hypothetical protein
MNQEKQKAATFEYLQKYSFILSKMRLNGSGIFGEEKEVKKEATEEKGKGIVEKVDFPDKGLFTYYSNSKYPAKGFPDGESVERLDEAKKMLMRILQGFHGISKIKFLLLIIFKSQIEKIAQSLIVSYWEYIKKYRLKPERYCNVSREIYRVFEKMTYGMKVEHLELWDKIKDNVCMILEFDDAYRYRFQDIITLLDKTEFKRNPIKELKRLFSILEERELGQGMKDKWRMVKKFIFLLKFKKEFKILKHFILQLNLEELKMDDADLYNASFKPTYKWDTQP